MPLEWTIVAAVAVIASVALQRAFRVVTIREYERGLRFSRGRLTDLLEPGRYRYHPSYTEIRRLDIRPTTLTIAGQEVLSADGVAVKVSLAATYAIVDPRQATLASENYVTALYAHLQDALRTLISASPIEQVLMLRPTAGKQITDQVQESAQLLGLRLEAVVIRDLTLPGELKKLFGQVVKARQEGLAALERARGESAAMRSLVNTAQLVDRHPALLQLRLLQVAGQQSGNTFVLGVGAPVLPVGGAGPGSDTKPTASEDAAG